MTANPQHDTPARPNFYILLGLDPGKAWDEREFETKLAESLKKWKYQKNNGPEDRQRDAQRCLDLVPQIREIMGDPRRRKIEADAARTLRDAEREQREAAYQSDLRILADGDDITEVTVAKLIKKYSDVVPKDRTTADIDRIKREQSLRLQAEPLPTIVAPEIAKDIRRNLDLIGQSDLFGFLHVFDSALNAKSPRVALHEAARKLYERLRDDRTRLTDNKKQAQYDLANSARTCFESDEKRQQYDNTLDYQKVETLLNQYVDLCGSTRHINSQQLDSYLTRAQELGCDRKLAYDFLRLRIKAYQRDKQDQQAWVIAPFPTQPITSPPPPPPAPPPTQRCGNPTCGAENDAARLICEKCLEPLRITCPNCGQKDMSTNDACTACGFAIVQRFSVRKLLKEGKEYLRADDLRQARMKLDEASSRWRPGDKDDLCNDISKLERDIDARQRELDDQERERRRLAEEAKRDQERREEERRRKEERELREQTERLESLIGMRHFFEAQPLARTLPASAPSRARYLAVIDDALTRARHFLDEAKRSGDVARQRDLCRQALDTCADLTEAREYRDKLPKPLPEAPAHLSVSVSERAAHLAWDASPTIGAGYIVVRKTGAPPLSASDGIRVYAGSAHTHDDRIDSGVFTYYAVYAERDGVVSRTRAGAVALLAAEVSDVACRAGDEMVELTWRTPAHVERVEIVRKAGAPPRARHDTSAQAITPTGANTLVDRDVRNGTEYFYALYCRYLDDQGHRHYSQGKTVSAIPEAPPASVPKLSISAHAMLLYPGQCKLEFTAAAPSRGDLVVLKCDQPPQLPVALRADRLTQYGRVLPFASIHVLEVPGTYWYVPVIRDQGMAYPGTPERYEWTGGTAT